MSAEVWQVRIEGALEAHFKQPAGPSRPGTDYKIGLKRGDQLCQIFVRAYLADDLTAAARKDADYQRQTVIGYVFDRLTPGWEPSGEMFPFPEITIRNPGPDSAPLSQPAPKRGFFGKLFGR